MKAAVSKTKSAAEEFYQKPNRPIEFNYIKFMTEFMFMFYALAKAEITKEQASLY